MGTLEHKIPPPVIAAICAISMWGVSTFAPQVEISNAQRITAAIAVVCVGGFFCIAGMASFRRAKTTVNPLKPDAATSLVSSGIYRFSRNPMYVGFAMILVAFAIFLASPWSLMGVVAFMLYINRYQIQPEERALAALFGLEFEQYKKSVRKWI